MQFGTYAFHEKRFFFLGIEVGTSKSTFEYQQKSFEI